MAQKKQATAINKVSKRKRKNVTLAVAHVSATFNNTIVTMTDVFGNKISGSSAGANGFKGARKSTPYAAQVTVDKVAGESREHGVKTISIEVNGPGGGRESALRALLNQGFVVTTIKDVSPIPHNGCRPPKRRRV
jgi:small subunit ribosomal protein S11